VLLTRVALGDPHSADSSDAAAAPHDAHTADERLSQLVEAVVREAIPQTFENTKHWGKREMVPNGLDIETEGLRLRISKRERAVRHGFWRRFRVTLLNPHETLHLRMENVRSPAPGQLRWDQFVSLRANVEARFEHWNLGVKLLNASTAAEATLELHADCSLTLRFETDEDSLAPLVVLKPTVHDVHLRLPDLDVSKFGTVRGSVAKELGHGWEEILEDLLQTQEKSIRKQAQKSIDKRSDDLRIPLPEFLTTPWAMLQ
jgi:hypothetical protein